MEIRVETSDCFRKMSDDTTIKLEGQKIKIENRWLTLFFKNHEAHVSVGNYVNYFIVE